MVKSLIEKMGGARMTEIRSGNEKSEEINLNPLQSLARHFGLRAYTPEGHRIIKERRKYHAQVKLRTFVKQTGETIYERTYWEKTGESIKPSRRHYNFEQYKDFNPHYNLTT